MHLEDAIQDYIASLEKEGKSSITCRAVRYDLERFVQFIGAHTELESITLSKVGKYLKSQHFEFKLNGSPRAQASKDRLVRSLRRLLCWCELKGYLEHAPIPKALFGKQSLKRKETLATEKDASSKVEP